MMFKNLFIPPLGTEIELAKDWTFALFGEYRNSDFFEYLGVESPPEYTRTETGEYNWELQSVDITLPADSTLKIDRIYIRKGQKDFDSVTFHLTRSLGKKVKKARFWVKLEDANKIIIKDE